MVNFGALAAEICWQDWGNPENFNGFRVLAALQHGTLVVGVTRQPNFAALNRGRHLYSAGRPSRWALTRISSHGRPMEYGRPLYFCPVVSFYLSFYLFFLA